MKKNKEQKGSILYSKKDLSVFDRRADYFNQSKEKGIDKLNSLTKFSSRQNIAKLLAQYEIFNITKGVTGDIIEGGVYFGSGLFGWANIAISKEPFNYQCKIPVYHINFKSQVLLPPLLIFFCHRPTENLEMLI